MAASLTSDKIAAKFGEETDPVKSPRAPLDGLVSIEYDRIDRDYRRDGDGDHMRTRNIYIRMVYQPPKNTSAYDFYGGSDEFLVVERVIPAGEGRTEVYTARLKQVWHRRIPAGASYQDTYEILLRVEKLNGAAF